MAVSQEESPSLPRKRQSFKTEDGEDVNEDFCLSAIGVNSLIKKPVETGALRCRMRLRRM